MRSARAPARDLSQRRAGATSNPTATRVRRGGTLVVRRAYRSCLLTWITGEPTQALIEQMRRVATDHDRRSVLISLDRATQILLLAEDAPDRPNGERIVEAVHSILDTVHALRPEARIQVVVGERIAPGERLASAATRLRRLARPALARPDELIWARRHSLDSLLETLDPSQAATFVEERLASVRAYDREHGTDLQHVLELALDHDNRNAAASAAFMHRNTFRRQLRKALELACGDIDDPDERLALHVALKLRGLGAQARLGGRFGRSGSDAQVHPG